MPTTRSTRNLARIQTPERLMHAREGTYPPPQKPMRICADCGYKDSSLVPPEKCPRCHNQTKNPLNEAALEARPMNRRERRKQAAERRAQERKVNRQIARETAKSGGKYEAS